MFSRQHHVAIIVRDYAASLRFYRDVLGLPLLRDTGRLGKGDRKLDFAFAGGELEVFVKPDAPGRPTYPEACGLRHLAFAVQDMEAAVAHLADHGVACEPLREDALTGRRMTFFFDPDGLPLELHE